MILLSLSDFSIQDPLIELTSDGSWYASLCILNQIGLVVLLEKSLTDQSSLLDEATILVGAHLAESDIELTILSSEFLKTRGVEIQLYVVPS